MSYQEKFRTLSVAQIQQVLAVLCEDLVAEPDNKRRKWQYRDLIAGIVNSEPRPLLREAQKAPIVSGPGPGRQWPREPPTRVRFAGGEPQKAPAVEWCPKHQCALPCRWCANTGADPTIIRAAEGMTLDPGEYEVVEILELDCGWQRLLEPGGRFVITREIKALRFVTVDAAAWCTHRTFVSAVRPLLTKKPDWCECEEYGQSVAVPCAPGTCPTVRDRLASERASLCDESDRLTIQRDSALVTVSRLGSELEAAQEQIAKLELQFRERGDELLATRKQLKAARSGLDPKVCGELIAQVRIGLTNHNDIEHELAHEALGKLAAMLGAEVAGG